MQQRMFYGDTGLKSVYVWCFNDFYPFLRCSLIFIYMQIRLFALYMQISLFTYLICISDHVVKGMFIGLNLESSLIV